MTENKTVRTRFAPSPTGFMHIGNLRTALYAYLFARANSGAFILRIEDTDQNRYVEGAVDFIYATLKKAGIGHDEGPDIGGAYGPYVQSERMDIYQKHAQALIGRGGAYYCFCDKEDATDENGFGGYDRRCRNIPPQEAKRRAEAGEPYVIRQKMPLEGTTSYRDEVFGEVEVENSALDDQVLIKRDGMPTYNFANVVDDHLMAITHVIRGTEYIVSTPKYKLLYEAFGWDVPAFVHLPLIMGQNEDGTVSKLSKRHGATSFEALLDMGYLPEAVVNYIALLGWSPKGNEEIFSMEALVNAFSLAGIGRSASVFDYKKLDWVNSQYLAQMSDEEFARTALSYAHGLGPLTDKWPLIAPLLKTRLSRLTEIDEKTAFLNQVPDYDLALYVNKKNKTDYAVSFDTLKKVIPLLEAAADWTSPALFALIASYAEESAVKVGRIMWPLRVALSGLAATPGGATDIMEILGKEESLKRLKGALPLLEAQADA